MQSKRTLRPPTDVQVFLLASPRLFKHFKTIKDVSLLRTFGGLSLRGRLVPLCDAIQYEAAATVWMLTTW